MPTAEIRRNGTPAYQRIQNAIRERIESGELKPGDAVSSERELAKLYQVSLMTARHALAGLEREGIVARRRGSGTFVAPPRIHFNKLMSYTEQMGSRGLPLSTKVLAIKVIEDEHEIAARLRLPATGRMVRLERVRSAGDEPFALEICYLSADDFPGLVSAPLGRTSLFATLEQEYGVELTYADEEVDATAADARVSHLLAIPREAPILRIRQVIFASTGKPAIYVVGFYRSERHSLFIRRFR